MKFKMFYALLVLVFFSCSDNEDNQVNGSFIDNQNQNTESVFALKTATSISTTPFSGAREAIIHKDELYAVTDSQTYKFNFITQTWNGITINNTEESFEVASDPSVDYNVSFIKDDKWYVLNAKTLFSFDFNTNKWTLENEFNETNSLKSPIGFYENGTLYVFSDLQSIVYIFDFESKSFVIHGEFDQQPNYGQLVKSIFKVDGEYYYTKLTYTRSIAVYKFTSDFKELNMVGEFTGNPIAQGSGFVYDQKIIFGLGIDATASNATYNDLNDSFYSFDTTTNKFESITNSFYEGRFLSLPFVYNDDFYLLGGKTINNTVETNSNTLDKLEFDFILE